MPPRVFNRLRLGPIVGHTDEQSSCIWIQVFDDPALYTLRVFGVGPFQFVSTEENNLLEFRTATATAHGLRPDVRYRYTVLRRGRVISRTRGTFRTMPLPGSMANILFCPISCSTLELIGLWEQFAEFITRAKPHFVLMMGDQVYLDQDKPDVFADHVHSSPAVRRKAMADKYHLNWSRDPVRRVMANVPVYMMWDDHDIRDGWGSLASDSPTMLQQYPRGAKVFRKCNAYFEDARDVYWHFQGCHNPLPFPGQPLPNYIEAPVPPNVRRAMPYAFRCGCLVVLMLDSRGERDIFRKDFPILGAEQWGFIQQVLDGLPPDVEALAVMTPTPIASMDPEGQTQKLFGDRTDDVEAFKRGDLEGVVDPESSSGKTDLAVAIVNTRLSRRFGRQLNVGNFKIRAMDEARDQWAHKFARSEQASLLRLAGKAQLTNALPGSKRGLIFLSGDIHVGCIYDIVSRDPAFTAASLTASGISAEEGESLILGTFLDEEFDVGSGIHSTLREAVREFNFGVVQVLPTGAGAQIIPSLVHEGTSTSFGIDITALL